MMLKCSGFTTSRRRKRRNGIFSSLFIHKNAISNSALILMSVSRRTRVGSRRPALANSTSSFGRVAEKRIVCLDSGSLDKISCSWAANPLSNSLEVEFEGCANGNESTKKKESRFEREKKKKKKGVTCRPHQRRCTPQISETNPFQPRGEENVQGFQSHCGERRERQEVECLIFKTTKTTRCSVVLPYMSGLLVICTN